MRTPIYIMLTRNSGDSGAALADALGQVAQRTKVQFRPLHPGVQDADLGRFFISEDVERSTAEQLIKVLSSMPGIEAAYIKPPDEPP